jgi:hypothetical protein
MNIYNRLERLARVRRMHRPGEDCPRPIPLPIRFKTAADVLTLLEEQIAEVRGDPEASALERARVVGFLTGIALKAIEGGNLQARLDMLEAVLKLRNGESKREHA